MPKNRLLNELDDTNTQILGLSHGQNVVTVDKDTPFNVLNIDGRTLVNLLGRDGNCEDISKWTAYGTTALDTTNYIFGSNGFKLTVTNDVYGGIGKTNLGATGQFDYTKCYIVIAYLKNGNGTDVRLRLVNNTIGASSEIGYTHSITDTSKFNYVWVKYNANQYPDSSVNIDIINIGSTGQYAYVDGIALYQISQADYNALATMTDAQVQAKYPYVDDVKHVQNPYLIKYGKNLIPPFQSWSLNTNTMIIDAYKASINITNATSSYDSTTDYLPILPNTTYTLSYGGLTYPAGATGATRFNFLLYDVNKAVINDNYGPDGNNTNKYILFTTPSNTAYVKVYMLTEAINGVYEFDYPQLELGSNKTVFEPQNNDYLFLTTKLASSMDGSVKDYVYYKDGQYYKSKRFITDVTLDGSLPWVYQAAGMSSKYVAVQGFISTVSTSSMTCVKYDGKILASNNGATTDSVYSISATNYKDLYIIVPNTDSGWAESYTPTQAEIQYYFMGYKMNKGDGPLTPYDGTGTKYWAPISNLSANSETTPTQQAVGYTPYKLTYQLAQEQEELIPFEGDIQLHSGGNQIEYGEGVIVREKANPKASANYYNINTNALSNANLTYRDSKFFAVYKNSIKDTGWQLSYADGNSYGTYTARVPIASFDPTAEYTTTYFDYDKYAFTTNVFSSSGSYNTNLKSVVNQISQELTDLTVAENALALRFQNFGIKGLGERVEEGQFIYTLNSTLGAQDVGTITFSRSFSKPPYVFLTLNGGIANMSGDTIFQAKNPTTTGFTLTMNQKSTPPGPNSTTTINWIAIGN